MKVSTTLALHRSRMMSSLSGRSAGPCCCGQVSESSSCQNQVKEAAGRAHRKGRGWVLALALPQAHVLGTERRVIGQQGMRLVHLGRAQRPRLRQAIRLSQDQPDLLAETPAQ